MLKSSSFFLAHFYDNLMEPRESCFSLCPTHTGNYNNFFNERSGSLICSVSWAMTDLWEHPHRGLGGQEASVPEQATPLLFAVYLFSLFTAHHSIHSVFVCCLLFCGINPGSVSLISVVFSQRLTRCSPPRSGIWARCRTMAMRIPPTNTWSRCRYKRDEDRTAPTGKGAGRRAKVVQCFGSTTDQQLLQEDFILHSELLDH